MNIVGNRKHYIYGLRAPDTEEIRYIGRTMNPKARVSIHMGHNGGVNKAKRAWAASLKEQGQYAEMVILETCDTREEAMEAETNWIHHFLPSGLLFNRNYRGCEGMRKGRPIGS